MFIKFLRAALVAAALTLLSGCVTVYERKVSASEVLHPGGGVKLYRGDSQRDRDLVDYTDGIVQYVDDCPREKPVVGTVDYKTWYRKLASGGTDPDEARRRDLFYFVVPAYTGRGYDHDKMRAISGHYSKEYEGNLLFISDEWHRAWSGQSRYRGKGLLYFHGPCQQGQSATPIFYGVWKPH